MCEFDSRAWTIVVLLRCKLVGHMSHGSSNKYNDQHVLNKSVSLSLPKDPSGSTIAHWESHAVVPARLKPTERIGDALGACGHPRGSPPGVIMVSSEVTKEGR